MGTEAPTIITIPVPCASKKAPCPTCGRLGRRKRILPPRRVRTVTYLEITCGEYLRSPVGRRMQTNNHVERANRMSRFLEKVRYKWRRRKTLVRFLVLRLDHIRNRAGETRSPQASRRPRKQAPARQQPRRVA
jgi:hypothetical protein